MARGENSVSSRALYLLQQPLVEELIAIRDSGEPQSGELKASTVEVSEDFKKVKVSGTCSSEAATIESYGMLLLEAISHSDCGSKGLEAIARECTNGEVESLEQVHLKLERMVSSTIYKVIIAIIIAGLALMGAMQYFWSN